MARYSSSSKRCTIPCVYYHCALLFGALATASSSPTGSIETQLSHAGLQGTRNVPMAPPLHWATTYTRPPYKLYEPHDSIYTRMDNPTRKLLETTLCNLEGECSGASYAFASGMMCVSSVLLAHQLPCTVIVPSDSYHGVGTVLHDVFAKFGVRIQQIDLRNGDALKTCLEKNIPQSHTVIVWIETPSNPKLHVIDIEQTRAIVNRYRSSKATTTIVVDSTLAPPTLCQPLSLGADIVVHSATKYLAGHSDACLGIATVHSNRTDLMESLRTVQVAVGGVASPMDCWLTLRGLKTLHLRVERQSRTAQQLADYLQSHPMVESVHYPDQDSIAQRQMKGLFGGVLSIEMSNAAMAHELAAHLQVIQRATSLGGTETLIEHRASIEPEHRRVSPPGLLRIAVGLEDPNDLVNDFRQALDAVERADGEKRQ